MPMNQYCITLIELIFLFSGVYVVFSKWKTKQQQKLMILTKFIGYFSLLKIIDFVMFFTTSPAIRILNAVTKSIEPAVISLPWLILFLDILLNEKNRLNYKTKNSLPPYLRLLQEQEAEKIKYGEFDKASAMAFLVQGINKIETFIISKEINRKESLQNDIGYIGSLLKLLFGWIKSSEENDASFEAPKGLQDSFVFGFPSLLSKVNIKSKREINKEAKSMVKLSKYLILIGKAKIGCYSF